MESRPPLPSDYTHRLKMSKESTTEVVKQANTRLIDAASAIVKKIETQLNDKIREVFEFNLPVSFVCGIVYDRSVDELLASRLAERKLTFYRYLFSVPPVLSETYQQKYGAPELYFDFLTLSSVPRQTHVLFIVDFPESGIFNGSRGLLLNTSAIVSLKPFCMTGEYVHSYEATETDFAGTSLERLREAIVKFWSL